MQGGPQKCTLKLQGFKPESSGEGGSGGTTVSKLDAKSREWTDVSLTTSEDPADQVVNGELEFKRHAYIIRTLFDTFPAISYNYFYFAGI